MKTIALTQDKVAIVDDEDFECLSKFKWCAAKRDNGIWYAVRGLYQNGKVKTILMHREILRTPVGVDTDHIDHDGLNNRHANLRAATNRQNHQNEKPREGGTSHFKGVCWHRAAQKWRARICSEGQNIHLGCFASDIEAAKVYDEAARKYFGDFARCNFPIESGEMAG